MTLVQLLSHEDNNGRALFLRPEPKPKSKTIAYGNPEVEWEALPCSISAQDCNLLFMHFWSVIQHQGSMASAAIGLSAVEPRTPLGKLIQRSQDSLHDFRTGKGMRNEENGKG